MVAYSIFLNFVEVFTLTAFVYLYYSFSNKKTFVLLFCCLLFGFEICDILRENGIVLMSFNFIVCYGFILYKKKVFNFSDLFILGFYIFSMNYFTAFNILFFETNINFKHFNNLYFSWNYIKNHTHSLYLLVNKTS